MALYRCDWQWPPRTALRDPLERDKDFARVFQAAPSPEGLIKAWYTYPGKAAGFLLVEASSHEELAQLLRPYTELMEFDVIPVQTVDLSTARQRFRA